MRSLSTSACGRCSVLKARQSAKRFEVQRNSARECQFPVPLPPPIRSSAMDYAGLRWSPTGYEENVRTQLHSLRQSRLRPYSPRLCEAKNYAALARVRPQALYSRSERGGRSRSLGPHFLQSSVLGANSTEIKKCLLDRGFGLLCGLAFRKMALDARHIEQVPLGVVDLLQVGIVADVLDALL